MSCIVYYLRERRNEINVMLHLLMPAVSALAFLTVLVATFRITLAGLGIQPLTYPESPAPWICMAWMVVGLIRLVSLRITALGHSVKWVASSQKEKPRTNRFLAGSSRW